MNDERIVILAPRGRDSAVIAETLSAQGKTCLVCADLPALTEALKAGPGAAILTEEALAEARPEALAAWLDGQPPWSDLPFIVLATRQVGRRTAAATERLRAIGNVVLLERPVNAETLVSAARSALRARRRQYAARDHMVAQTRAEEALRFALEAGRLGAWDLTLDGLRLSASAIAKAHYGRGPDDVFTYKQMLASIHPDDVERRRSAVRQALDAGHDMEVEYRVSWPDGTLHWVQIRGRAGYRPGDGARRVTGVSLDITARKQAEAALRALNDTLELRVAESTEQLRQSNRRLLQEIAEREQAQAALIQAQKMEAIGQLTGGIAHDFNNLLTAIIGNVDMIEMRAEDPKIKRMAGFARQGVERATKLTGQLLAFSRSQQLDLQPIAVDDLLAGMDNLLARSLGHTVRVVMDLQAGPTLATGDRTQLELAVLNLAINARDAMETGGTVTVASRVTDEWPEGLKPGRHVVISVSDTGKGIPPDILAKIFDPFFTTKSVGKGTGLGLSQVYGIATQSGGTVKVHSQPGEGATIEIWLPLSDADERVRPSEIAIEQAPIGHGEKVLVIDDDPDVRRFIVEGLETLGYQVSWAEDGRSGLERLAGDAPALLVVDYAMPGMTGVQVAEQARRQCPGLTVLLVTGYADAGAIEQLVSAEQVLRKPFRIVDLAVTARRLLDAAVEPA